MLREKETTGHDRPRQLSPRMVQFAHAVLRNALSNAVGEELVGRNVAKMVKTRNSDYQVGGGLDPVAARALLVQITDDGTVPRSVFLARHAGLRSGEMGTDSDDIRRYERGAQDR